MLTTIPFFRSPPVRYLLAGILAYTLELLCLSGLRYVLDLGTVTSTAIAFWVGLTAAFLIQKVWAFKDNRRDTAALTNQTVLYSLLVGLNYCFTLAVVSLAPDEYLLISRTIALVVTTVWNYFIYKHLIFNQSRGKRTLKELTKMLRDNRASYTTLGRRGFIVSSLAILICVSVFTAYFATRNEAGVNGDELANTYMVSDGWESFGFTVVDVHTNLVKMPILLLQAAIGMELSAFIAVNIALVVATNLLWFGLLSRIFKGWALGITTLALACFQLGGILFSINFVYKSFRNIEIAIIGWLIYLLASQLYRISWIRLSIFIVSYAIILSGDAYYQYVISLPLLFLLFILWLRKFITSQVASLIGGAVIIASLTAKLINKIIDHFGLFNILFEHKGATYLVPYEQIGAQISLTGREVLRIFGADFFGVVLDKTALGAMFSMTLLLLCVAGSFSVIYQLLSSKSSSGNRKDLIGLFLAGLGVLIPVFTVLVYVLSGQAKPDSELARYLIIIPFWLIIPFGLIVQKMIAYRPSMNILLPTFIILGMFLSLPGIHNGYRQLNAVAAINQDYYHDINKVLLTDKVGVVVTGHWTATPLRFWAESSGKELISAPVQNCNERLAFLNRKSWYESSYNQGENRSALVIDRLKDADAWNCTESQLRGLYGSPKTIIKLANPVAQGGAGSVTEIWEYDYDVRARIKHSNQ